MKGLRNSSSYITTSIPGQCICRYWLSERVGPGIEVAFISVLQVRVLILVLWAETVTGL